MDDLQQEPVVATLDEEEDLSPHLHERHKDGTHNSIISFELLLLCFGLCNSYTSTQYSRTVHRAYSTS
jgi:hypothetical protein